MASQIQSEPRIIDARTPSAFNTDSLSPAAWRFGIKDVLRGLSRFKWAIALNLTVWLALTWLSLVSLPRSYESEAKLILRIGRESVGLDPTATTGQTIMLQKSQEDEINSAVEILGSRQIAEQVVDAIGVEQVLDESSRVKPQDGPAAEPHAFQRLVSSASSALENLIAWTGVRDSLGEREQAIRKVDRSRDISSRRRSTVISITAKGKSPESAQRLAAAITESFLATHARANSTSGALSFFSEQSELLDGQLTAKQRELQEFKQKHLLVSADARRDILKLQLTEIESALLKNANEMEYAREKVRDLGEKLAASPGQLVLQRLETKDDAFNIMRERLYQLEIEERKLQSTHQPGHPALVAITNQREEVENILKQQQNDRVDTTEGMNPNRLALELLRQTEDADLTARRSRQAELLRQRESLRAEANQFAIQEVELARLQREADLLSAAFAKHSEKREEARINEALESDRISNVNVVQPASLVEKPTSPSKILIVAVGGILALATSLSFATAAEFIDSSVQTRERAESATGVQVLLSIPRYDRRWKSRQLPPPLREKFEELYAQLLDRAATPASTRSIGILGCSTGAGASSIAAKLSIAAANRPGRPFLLIDSDAERRSISDIFGLNGAPGLLDTIRGTADAESCVLPSCIDNLEILPSGSAKSAAQLDPKTLAARIDAISGKYDTVFVDLPAANGPGRGIRLARGLDGVVLVIDAGSTKLQTARQVRERLASSGVEVVGVVLNKSKNHLPAWLDRLI